MGKILQWENVIAYPEELSDEAVDLLERLICSEDKRMTSLEDFINHPFFKGIEWKNLRKQQAPILPIVRGPTDGRNYDDFPEEDNGSSSSSSAEEKEGKSLEYNVDDHLDFIGYTFNAFNFSSSSSVHPRE